MILMDGSARCDRCGTTLENAGLSNAIVVTDIDTLTGSAVTMHLGRKCGCATLILPEPTLQYRVNSGLPVGDATNPPPPEEPDAEADDPAPAGDAAASTDS